MSRGCKKAHPLHIQSTFAYNFKSKANNRRSNKIIIINGVKCTLENWIRKSVIKSSTVRQRFYAYGWKIEKALGMEVPVV